jgi:hypothetical protein
MDRAEKFERFREVHRASTARRLEAPHRTNPELLDGKHT